MRRNAKYFGSVDAPRVTIFGERRCRLDCAPTDRPPPPVVLAAALTAHVGAFSSDGGPSCTVEWAQRLARVLRRHSTFLALLSTCAEALRPPAPPPDSVSPSSKRRRAAPARTTSRCTCLAPSPSGYSTARSCNRLTRHAPVPRHAASALHLAMLRWRRSPAAVSARSRRTPRLGPRCAAAEYSEYPWEYSDYPL